MTSLVSLARCDSPSQAPYPAFPFGPGGPLPEFPQAEAGPPNPVFAAVRRCLYRLGLDRERFGTPAWNPLADLIEPGQQVLIKPNWVLHAHAGGGSMDSLVTHMSVLRPVLDYVLLALRSHGRVIIGDAPIQSADFARLVEAIGIARLLDGIQTGGVDVAVCDFRENTCELDRHGRVLGHHSLPGSPDRYTTVDVGAQSLLEPVSEHAARFRVTNYDPSAMRQHHGRGRHEYLVAKAVLDSHVVIGVPKLKTHRKAGLTCCLKNVVGINGSKDYLPHHRLGAPVHGGDEYQWPSAWKALGSRIADRLEISPRGMLAPVAILGLRVCRRLAHHTARDPYSEGSWYGNDTIWRTVVDLNRVLEYARPDGNLATTPQRKMLHIVDAVVCGGGEGPLRPDPVRADLILAGRTAAAVDCCTARLVGLNPARIPLVRHALETVERQEDGPPEIRLIDGDDPSQGLAPDSIRPVACLAPPSGWAGHVELEHCPPSPVDRPVDYMDRQAETAEA